VKVRETNWKLGGKTFSVAGSVRLFTTLRKGQQEIKWKALSSAVHVYGA